MIKTIALNKLQRSATNVRRQSDERADAQLKDDIAAHGLLQNLVVTALTKPRGHYAVEAGGRRLAALQQLAEEGRIEPDTMVSCLVLDRGALAEEASLAENFQQLRMNPADECLAFQRLLGQGLDAEAIAVRFGVSRRFVEGRLRLADLAPVVFEALGAGDITLDIAKAFAVTSDRDRQAQLFEQMGNGYGAYYADSIRRMMVSATVPGSDRRARFVGEEAYLAAGGRIERDLFADDETARWTDVPLLDTLAMDKLANEADARRDELGIAFVRPTLDGWIGYRHAEGLAPVDLEQPPLTDHEAATIAAAEQEIEQLQDLFDDDAVDDAARIAASARIDELQRTIDAIDKRLPIIDEDLKDRLGTFLLIDETGAAVLHHRFYLDVAGDEEDEAIEADGTACGAGSTDGDVSTEPPSEPKPAGLSARLADELAMQRRDLLAVHLAADPMIAADLAIFLLADRVRGYGVDRSGSTLVAPRPHDPVLAANVPASEVTGWRQEASDALERGWQAQGSIAERFEAFRQLSAEARAAWLGEAVAHSLEASLNQPGPHACELHDRLGELLGIEVAAMWRPTATNYFDRVPKALCLAALAEVGGPALAALHAKAKKADLAATCERIFAGDALVDPETRMAALAWVPEAMRFACPPWIGDVDGAGVGGDEAATEVEAPAGPEVGIESEPLDQAA